MGTSALGIADSGCSIPAELLGPLGWKAAPAEPVGAELGFPFPPNLSLICAVPAQPEGIPALEDGVLWALLFLWIKAQPGTLSQTNPSLPLP